MEWQANGWPHLHVLLRSKFIPKKFVADAWHDCCWPGFVDIKKIASHDGIPYELTKYICKAYLVANALDKNQRLFSSSRKFFPPQPESDPVDFDPAAEWFITSENPDSVRTTLSSLPWLSDQLLQPTDGYAFRWSWLAIDTWAKLTADELEALPWYKPAHSGLCHPPPF